MRGTDLPSVSILDMKQFSKEAPRTNLRNDCSKTSDGFGFSGPDRPRDDDDGPAIALHKAARDQPPISTKKISLNAMNTIRGSRHS